MDAFRVKLNDALRLRSDPVEIQAEALRILGEHLHVSRALYAEVEPRSGDDYCIVRRDYHAPHVPSIVGAYRVDDYGATFVDAMRAGRTFVVGDVEHDTRLGEGERERSLAVAHAYVAVPLVKAGRFAALLGLQQAAPREWKADDIALAEETAERTWAAVERAQAEEALRQGEERARMLSRNLPGGAAFIFDGELRYVLADGESLYAVGRTPADYEGNTIAEVLPPALVAQLEPPLRRALEGESFEIEAAQNEQTFVSRGVPLPASNNNVAGVLVVSYDITERKQAEESLAQAYAAEQAARADAEAALQTRDQFLSIASHELRTPLTSLMGYASLLPKATARGTGDAAKMTERILRQAQRLNGLVDQLLDVSRLQRGQFAIERRSVDLAALVAQVTDEMRTTLPPTTNHTIEVIHPHEPVIVDGDAQRLEQVVQNLLSNALKYSPEGGPVRVALQRIATNAVLDVADHGIGIPQEAQARLFEPFYRAPNVGGQASGFGLGLHIVREIMERHGGRIEITSTQGEGSTFHVVLPLRDAGNGSEPGAASDAA